MESYKFELQNKLLNQLINNQYLKYSICDKNKIEFGMKTFSFIRDELGSIKLNDSVLYEYSLKELLKNTNLEKECKKMEKLLEKSYDGYLYYEEMYKKIFEDNNIFCVEDLFKLDVEEFNNICNRIIDREQESNIYAFMYLNEIPLKYHLMNQLYIEIPFVSNQQIRNINNEVVSVFNGYLPVHPMYFENNKKQFSKMDVKYKKCMMSSSHRTFTYNNLDYYFKIDLPCRISSSMRTLTRNSSRLEASNIAMKALDNYKNSFDKKLYILGDICFVEYCEKTVVLRHREKGLRLVPLHALIKKLPISSESILDYFLSKGKCKSVERFLLKNIFFPLLEVFNYYVTISETIGKFILPYNFHRQNIGLVVEKDKITGVYTQDLDMQYDLNSINVCLEFDSMLTYFIIIPIMKYMEKYNINKEYVYIQMEDYINSNLENLKKYFSEKIVKNKLYVMNLIRKDFSYIPYNKYYYNEKILIR